MKGEEVAIKVILKAKKNCSSSQASIQPGGTVTFEHRNIKGQNRSIVGSVTSSNLLNPQDDLSFKLEYVHPYLDGVYNGARQLPTGALSMDGPLTTLSSTGVDRMAFAQANITCDNTKFVNSAIVGERNVFQLDQGLGIGTNFPFFNHRQLTLTRFILGGPNSVRGYNMAPQPEEHDLPTSTHSIPSVHSMAARPLHLRNHRPNRAAKRAEKRATRAEDARLPRPCKKARGKNKAHRLAPSSEADELAFPLHFDEEFRIIGSNAERFGQYIGQKSRQFTDFPLHLNWCAHHERSFEIFFLQAQKDYEFLPQDPYCPLNLPVIYRGIRTKMQERVQGNRNQVKMECYELWLKTPEEKRRALFQEKVFEEIDENWWGDLCSFYSSKSKQRAQIEESGGSSSALKEYLGTHATLVDPNGDTYSCIYPDTQTQEYCEPNANFLEVRKLSSVD
ncbi:uncharacterized protein A4U43_C04F20340 [Asparagus officinalis]|uniref:Uncharacterized protein n=1 Tax=Asparagus officinalis TaxID=4686 RepID=A0A5P1F533_ASPOF|nr:uncharacterized protein A4U43_C04F20340 [Asparagus officinalis]